VAGAARAQSNPLLGAVTQNLYFAWHDNDGLFFILEGTSSTAYSQGNGITYAPRIAQTAPLGSTLWFTFSNGAAGQLDLFTGDPGDPNYSPVAHVYGLIWRTRPVLLKSYKDVFSYARTGALVAYDTGAWLNAPVVWQETDLGGNGGHLATSLLAGAQIREIKRTAEGAPDQVVLNAFRAYFNNQVYGFLDLDHADGNVPDLSGQMQQVTPVPRLARPQIGSAVVAKLYAIEGQDVVVNTVPGRSDYTPLWQIIFVRRQSGFTTLLTSEQAILAAQSAGKVTLQSAGDDAIFNCPIVSPSVIRP
jgi:hypothetical protein